MHAAMARPARLALAPLLLLAAAVGAPAPARADAGRTLAVTAVDSQPKEGREKPSDADLLALEKAVSDAPDDRVHRFDHVRGLIAAGKLEDAAKAARAWREKDAYNLVVIRLLGDIYSELGDRDRAQRTYSAVVELWPGEPAAQRALATVLNHGGNLEGAHDGRRAATALRPDDVRIGFELADVAQRLGHVDEATDRFEKIVVNEKTSEAVRYPAKQRLGQIYAANRRDALAKGDRTSADKAQSSIEKLGLKGGTTNDIKVYLSWDTDRTDVDLHVVNPAKEDVNYQHRTGRFGEALFDDVTSGYGPESFTAQNAVPGTYEVKVNYYGTSRQTFTEARGEVVVITSEGTANERRQVLPYRLFKRGQTVTVARIEVK
jgi:Flp pilus assembly protein TadD